MNKFVCSVVFASPTPNLHRAIFDERIIFSTIDDNQSLMMGPAGNFSYNSGNEVFSVQPDKLMLRQKSSKIFHKRLVSAANQVAHTIHDHYRPHTISGIGLNLEVQITSKNPDKNPVEFCNQLLNLRKVSTFFDKQVTAAFPRWVSEESELLFDVSIHPEFHEENQNLILTVNVHQNVSKDEQLIVKLSSIDKVRHSMEKLHDQLLKQATGKSS